MFFVSFLIASSRFIMVMALVWPTTNPSMVEKKRGTKVHAAAVLPVATGGVLAVVWRLKALSCFSLAVCH